MSNLEPIGASEQGFSHRPSAAGPVLTSTALRAALQAQLRSQRTVDDPQLRRLACLVALEARRRSLRAEQVVVQLKQTWLTLHESADPPRRGQTQLIERLISLCVEEYYRTPDDR